MSVLHAPSSNEVVRTDILAPLRFFYGLASADLRVSFVRPEEMPDAERWLLVHESDMTPRLRDYHHNVIILDVHAKSRIGNYLVRASVLKNSADGSPVEFGAIGIHLQDFDEETRRMILECRIPLGGILEQQKVPHSSHPSGYFRIEIDHRLAELLGGFDGQICFGRCNELRHADGSPLAEVVEVLPGNGN